MDSNVSKSNLLEVIQNLKSLHDFNLNIIEVSAVEIKLSFQQNYSDTPRHYRIYLREISFFVCDDLKEGNCVLDIDVFEKDALSTEQFHELFQSQIGKNISSPEDIRQKYVFALWSSYGCDILASVGEIIMTEILANRERICCRVPYNV